ncbi:MAG: glycosyltransferase family 2 protein [Zunongwangia sp.]|jgi:cellulose synthase/poly-beta-1,6-N-acetylglucosamine synthase-like glycosyltransferase|uniref:Transmembrane family-2 glycosyl transferase n=1 Tax=Zunongwangia profunda (strain DSM 18752 / CCTCC AB 206139 / SM-A87) TaxID=655815 RepID=D5BC22_ZUNPS|nr:glycosyltransferase [Zunongwangia profunda]ADF52621.1 transmembrane family-2 glycosyl transferase [Zunongwangia profunda SM-A87]MAO35544.1 glycosyltransferase family 2 protein [Zunongwangia sp.]MCC4227605.1 glycosyltransferase [Zunongwangia profunda]|tara:strand:+ start:7308 stop:8735 length:1428 start_codon:yes stop_codon:yes gene_type:complete
MSITLDDIANIASWLFLVYGILICLGYLFSAIFSIFEIRDYKRSNNYKDEIALLQASELPPVSILAPAYNEGLNIVENVRSLLTINYPSFEIVIINDGSKDDTMQRLIEEYDLEKQDYLFHYFIKTKTIRGVYKSKNTAFKNLLVIDKENGGKADALNTGINVCSHDIICCIDVDCILEYDAMLKLIKPFLNDRKKVIASGGVIRVANSCVIEDGRIIEVRLPEKFVARVQVIEYFRAFLMGRMAWSRIDGLLLISGAFGMFDKQIAIEAGGYNHNTVGEDMELLVRMRRMMREKNIPYKVGFVPDPLCWTEVPQSWEILKRQRNRWTRGTAETLLLHKKMIFNPKYGVLGVLSTPFWLFFEWMAPLIEFSGTIFFIFLLWFGLISWKFFLTFLLVVYAFAVLFSITALFFEEYSFQQYKKPKYIFTLIGTAFLEPIVYHPFVMWAAVRGNWDLIIGKKSWGEMTRTGLSKSTKK